MKQLNNDYEIDIEYSNYDIENGDTTCPVCKNKKNRFWLTFYCDETLLVCRDCGYHQLI